MPAEPARSSLWHSAHRPSPVNRRLPCARSGGRSPHPVAISARAAPRTAAGWSEPGTHYPEVSLSIRSVPSCRCRARSRFARRGEAERAIGCSRYGAAWPRESEKSRTSLRDGRPQWRRCSSASKTRGSWRSVSHRMLGSRVSSPAHGGALASTRPSHGRRFAWPPSSTMSAWPSGISRPSSTRRPSDPSRSWRWRSLTTCDYGRRRRRSYLPRAATRPCWSRCTAARSTSVAISLVCRPRTPAPCVPTSPASARGRSD